MLWAALFLINGAGFVGSMPPVGSPENITVMFLSPTAVRVSWTTSIEQVEKYDVTYKPTDASYRVVAVVAGNSDSVTLSSLQADTQYQITVTAVRDGKKYKSRPIVFRTLELPRTNEVQITPPGGRGGGPRAVPPLTNMPPTYIQVRGVEVGIVVLVLMVWVGAIILFFNRWGKIRMLLPYQPDYKDTQLKVPGTGTSGTCQSTQGNGFCCSQLTPPCYRDAVCWTTASVSRRPPTRGMRPATAASHFYTESRMPSYQGTSTTAGLTRAQVGGQGCLGPALTRLFTSLTHRPSETLSSLLTVREACVVLKVLATCATRSSSVRTQSSSTRIQSLTGKTRKLLDKSILNYQYCLSQWRRINYL